MPTSLAGPWRRPRAIARRRWRSFFSCQAEPFQEPGDRRRTGRRATCRQTRVHLGDRDPGCLPDPGPNVMLVPGQRRCLEPTEPRRPDITGLVHPLHQLDHAADTDLKNRCRSSTRHAAPDALDHPLPQIIRIGSCHTWLASSSSHQLESHLATAVNPPNRFHLFEFRSSTTNRRFSRCSP